MKGLDQDGTALERLQARLRILLPAVYGEREGPVEPVPMRSAGLVFASDGTVAWDRIWGSFCDLAMAGGPPHKGRLLEPGSAAEIAGNPGGYRQVVAEICRGIGLVTGLDAEASDRLGWVRVDCPSAAMAGWLARAIAMENVSVRVRGAVLELPAGAGFRLEREIKNVITVIAKTCHYWRDHMPREQQLAVGELLQVMDAEGGLVQPGLGLVEVSEWGGLRVAAVRYEGWLGVECSSVAAAVWMMRALTAGNVMARREEMVLFVALGADADGVIWRVVRGLELGALAGVL